MSNLSELQKYNKRLEQLRTERSHFMDYWGELSDYHLAHRGRFLLGKQTQVRRNTKQYNNTSRLAARTLGSGMMAGITSPARPWFKMQSGNPDLDEYASVKEWLTTVQAIIYQVFAKSNTYNSLHTLYNELGVFGTGAMGVFENFDTVIRCKTYTIGSYMLGLGADDIIDTFYREYTNTVGQLVKKYGIENVPDNIKQQWKNGNIENPINCVHLVEPNDDRNEMSPLARDMAFRSVYYVKDGSNGASAKPLMRSGFRDFAILTPRWDIVGEEIYSEDCPGMTTLGDTKALQLGEKRMYQGLDKLTNPTLQGDANLKQKLQNGQAMPGDFIAVTNGQVPISSIYGNYNPHLDIIQNVQQTVELRIKRGFYEDLFLMLANSDRRQITAREVAEKHEEKLLMLGPVLERLHSELLGPLINRTFSILQTAGVFPPPPPELNDMELNVEYVSVLAQAQRMVGITGIERTVGFAMSMAQVWPNAALKIDAEQVVDEYGQNMGVSPRIIRPDEDVQKIKDAQAAAQAQQQQMAQAEQAANVAQTVSQTSTADGNALSDLLRANALP